jgi:flagellar motor switch protein FliN/FliY
VLIDQDEINALLQASSAGAKPAEPLPAPAAPSAPFRPVSRDPELMRVLRIRVPVIVQLARRNVALSKIRQLSNGSILEFDRQVDSPLELLIRNRPIARGVAVKVGENFGLQISEVESPARRIQSLGA